MSAIFAFIHTEFEGTTTIGALDCFYFNRISLRLERGFVISEIGAQTFEPRKIRVAGYFACPIKVLEYMASSRPLIASNMPIVRELVREDVDALLFSPNDPDDLARQVLTLLGDFELSKRLSESATERALSQFTWHEAQRKLLKLYERLLA